MIDLFGNEMIHSLTWYQPYANLMLPPFNKIETRTYPTNVRGKVLGCAGQKMLTESDLFSISGEWQTGRIFEALRNQGTKEIRGSAIFFGDLIDCRPMTKEDADRCFVAYREPWEHTSKKTGKKTIKRLWCWIFEDVNGIEPFAFSGSQGWGIVDEETKLKIKIIK